MSKATLARRAAISPETVRKLFTAGGNPEIRTVAAHSAAVPPASPNQSARWCGGANWPAMSAATSANENVKPAWTPRAMSRRATWNRAAGSSGGGTSEETTLRFHRPFDG
jgi:hypothetical protein